MTMSDEIEEFQLSELEKKAEERRERLKAMRANRMAGKSIAENAEGIGLLGIVGRRSYQPVNVVATNVDEDVKEIIKGTSKMVDQIIKDSKNLTLGDNLDVSIIAPRKVDWDLRRGIQDQLEKLERRTNNSINTLVRQKVMKENGDLATKVNAIADQKN